MSTIAIGGLLIELISKAIGGAGEHSTKMGLKKLRSLLELEDVKSGKSAFSEVNQLLQISYFQSISLILDECKQVLEDLLQGKLEWSQFKAQFKIGISDPLSTQVLSNEIKIVNKLKAEVEKKIQKLQPKTNVTKAASALMSKIKGNIKSSNEIELQKAIKEIELREFPLSQLSNTQENDHKFMRIENKTIEQIVLLDFPTESLIKRLMEKLVIHQNKLAIYGGSFFSFHLKNNPVLMNILQTHFILGMRTEVSEIKRILVQQFGVNNLDGIESYLTNLSKKYREKDIHGFDVFTLPITLKPGNFRFIGQATLHIIPERCIAIHGRPACGKTTLVRRILTTSNPDSFYIPIEIPLSDRVDILTVREIIKRILKLQNDNAFEYLENTGRLIIIFDGLNEVRDIYGASRQLSFLAEQFENSRFIVTSRTHELKNEAGLSDFKDYEIQPLSQDDQLDFIEIYIADARESERLKAIFKELHHLRNVCSNQFIFLLSIDLLLKKQLHTDKISDFYSNFLNGFLLQWEKNRGTERMRHVLEDIAYKMIRSSSSTTYIEEEIIDELWNKEPKVCTEEEFTFLLKSGFIEKRGNAYRLFQETFQEYLIASWLVRNGIFPVHLKEETPGKWLYKNEFELSELIYRFYIELSGIREFNKGSENLNISY